jgi:peptide/nickel transport system substrate-binding protein
VLELDVQNFVQLGSAKDINVYATPSPNQYIGVFTPHNMPPFDDVKVRQAFKWLLDRQALVDSLQFGKAIVANDEPLAPGNRWNFNQNSLTQYKQDLDKAKSLLEQAGKSNLNLDLFSWTARPPGPDIAVAMQAAADKIGVTINVKPVDTATYFGDVIFKKSLYTSGRASRMPTLWDTIYAIYHSKSPVNYGVIEVTPGLDDLLERVLGELDASKQQAMVAQAMTLIHDNGFWIMPMFMNNFAAASNKVGGLQAPVSDATMDFRRVFLAA